MLELNLWISKNTGNINGTLNINRKEEIQKIGRFYTARDFCNFLSSCGTPQEFIDNWYGDPTRDLNAYYGSTEEGNVVCFNPKHSYLTVTYNDVDYILKSVVMKGNFKRQPDVSFRG